MERYKDKQLSAYERAAALADTLSTEEQAQQLKYDAPAIEKAGLPSYNWWNEGLHGVARAGTATVFPQAIALAAAFDKDMIVSARWFPQKRGQCITAPQNTAIPTYIKALHYGRRI